MTVVSLSLPDNMLKLIDEYVAKYGYTSRSELIREAVRDFILREAPPEDQGKQSTFVILVVTSKLVKQDADERVVQIVHLHSDVVKMLHHYKLDEETCLNIIIAKGLAKDIIEMARRLRGIRGVTDVWVKDITSRQLVF